MRSMLRVLVVVLALMLSTATVATADGGGHGHGGRPSVVPATWVGGSTGSQLLGDWYAQNLSLKGADSPFGQTANKCLTLGLRGQVLSPAGGLQDPPGTISMSCPVKADQSIFIVTPSADCSSAEPEPFQADTAWGQRKCALRWLFDATITSIDVNIDGARSVDIHSPRFLTVSPQRKTVFDAVDPVFGAEKGAKATFVAAGWGGRNSRTSAG